MPSTDSTGYPRRVILMEQPTSSGQIEDFSSGCQAIFRDSAVLNMTTGSVAAFGGDFRQTAFQTITTTGGTITNNGLTIMTLATTDGTYSLASPVAGSVKDILMVGGTNHEIKIIPASSASYFGGSSQNKQMIFSSDLSAGLRGNCISLKSTGTVVWRVLTIGSTVDFAYSTAIT